MSHFKIVSSLRQLYLIRDQCWTNPATFVDASLSWVLWLKRFPARRTLEIVAALLCSLWSPSWPVTMSISNCSPSMLSAWLLPSPSPEARSKNLYDSRQRHKTFYYKRSDFKQRVCVSVYLSELRAGLGVCRGRSAMQKSSTVNFPSFLSAPYIAITLPEREEMPRHARHIIIAVFEWFNTEHLIGDSGINQNVLTSRTVLTCDTLVSVNFALQFDSLELVFQD